MTSRDACRWSRNVYPEYTVVITVDGKCHPVSINLWHALRRVRHGSGERVLWADGACVNQNDLEERVEEVELIAS
jgi:Heterokaryon incompatibility protein (HET)